MCIYIYWISIEYIVENIYETKYILEIHYHNTLSNDIISQHKTKYRENTYLGSGAREKDLENPKMKFM